MRTGVLTPPVFLAACALSIGVMAQAAPPEAGADATPGDDAGAPADATTAGDGPTPADWPGPPNVDGALDDGALPPMFDGGDILAYLGLCETLPTPYSYSSVKAPYTDVAGCKAFNPQGHKAAHDCACDKCFDLSQQCDAIPGCREIAKCFQDSNCISNTSVCLLAAAAYPGLACSATLTCYLFPSAPCTAVIDKWGNGSVSTGLSAELELCAQAAKCPLQ